MPLHRSRSGRTAPLCAEPPNREPFSAGPFRQKAVSTSSTTPGRKGRQYGENQPPENVNIVRGILESASPSLHKTSSKRMQGSMGSPSLPPMPPSAKPSPAQGGQAPASGAFVDSGAKRKLSWDAQSAGGTEIPPSPAHMAGTSSHIDTHAPDSGVKVIVRARPLTHREEQDEGIESVFISHQTISIAQQTFTFDAVAGPDSSQQDLFTMVGVPMVDNCVAGFNSSIFAYGQTGSGKTYTMWGTTQDPASNLPPSENRGIAPRLFEQMFARIQQEEVKHAADQLRYQCRCSFLEIYNEQITDLLEPSQKNLQIREDTKAGVYVENLSEEYVSGVNDISQLLLKGLANRRVGSTMMNNESSRSHSVFTCVIECRFKSLAQGVSSIRSSRMNLVDLAGSERQKQTGAAGERLKEAGNINRSLSQLGNVINILAEVAQSGKQRHIPYRDSRLTFLLQESLGGNAKLAMICAISIASSCRNETLSTLRFAKRAKAIQNKAIVNEETANDVKLLREQIRQLKEELMRMKANGAQQSSGWNPRRSYNLLRMSLTHPMVFPKGDMDPSDSDEEMEIDDDDAEVNYGTTEGVCTAKCLAEALGTGSTEADGNVAKVSTECSMSIEKPGWQDTTNTSAIQCHENVSTAGPDTGLIEEDASHHDFALPTKTSQVAPVVSSIQEPSCPECGRRRSVQQLLEHSSTAVSDTRLPREDSKGSLDIIPSTNSRQVVTHVSAILESGCQEGGNARCVQQSLDSSGASHTGSSEVELNGNVVCASAKSDNVVRTVCPIQEPECQEHGNATSAVHEPILNRVSIAVSRDQSFYDCRSVFDSCTPNGSLSSSRKQSMYWSSPDFDCLEFRSLESPMQTESPQIGKPEARKNGSGTPEVRHCKSAEHDALPLETSDVPRSVTALQTPPPGSEVEDSLAAGTLVTSYCGMQPVGDWPIYDDTPRSKSNKGLRLDSPMQTESPQIGQREALEDEDFMLEVSPCQATKLEAMLSSAPNASQPVTGMHTFLEDGKGAGGIESRMQTQSSRNSFEEAVEDDCVRLEVIRSKSTDPEALLVTPDVLQSVSGVHTSLGPEFIDSKAAGTVITCQCEVEPDVELTSGLKEPQSELSKELMVESHMGAESPELGMREIVDKGKCHSPELEALLVGTLDVPHSVTGFQTPFGPELEDHGAADIVQSESLQIGVAEEVEDEDFTVEVLQCQSPQLVGSPMSISNVPRPVTDIQIFLAPEDHGAADSMVTSLWEVVPEGEWLVQEQEQDCEVIKVLGVESPEQSESPQIGVRHALQDREGEVEETECQSAQLEELLVYTPDVSPPVTGVQTPLALEFEDHGGAVGTVVTSQTESQHIGMREQAEDGDYAVEGIQCQSPHHEVSPVSVSNVARPVTGIQTSESHKAADTLVTSQCEAMLQGEWLVQEQEQESEVIQVLRVELPVHTQSPQIGVRHAVQERKVEETECRSAQLEEMLVCTPDVFRPLTDVQTLALEFEDHGGAAGTVVTSQWEVQTESPQIGMREEVEDGDYDVEGIQCQSPKLEVSPVSVSNVARPVTGIQTSQSHESADSLVTSQGEVMPQGEWLVQEQEQESEVIKVLRVELPVHTESPQIGVRHAVQERKVDETECRSAQLEELLVCTPDVSRPVTGVHTPLALEFEDHGVAAGTVVTSQWEVQTESPQIDMREEVEDSTVEVIQCQSPELEASLVSISKISNGVTVIQTPLTPEDHESAVSLVTSQCEAMPEGEWPVQEQEPECELTKVVRIGAPVQTKSPRIGIRQAEQQVIECQSSPLEALVVFTPDVSRPVTDVQTLALKFEDHVGAAGAVATSQCEVQAALRIGMREAEGDFAIEGIQCQSPQLEVSLVSVSTVPRPVTGLQTSQSHEFDDSMVTSQFEAIPEGEWPVQEQEPENELTKVVRVEAPLPTESPRIGIRQPVEEEIGVIECQCTQLEVLLVCSPDVPLPVTGVRTPLALEFEDHGGAAGTPVTSRCEVQTEPLQIGMREVEDGGIQTLLVPEDHGSTDCMVPSQCEAVPEGKCTVQGHESESELIKVLRLESPLQVKSPQAARVGEDEVYVDWCQSTQLEALLDVSRPIANVQTALALEHEDLGGAAGTVVASYCDVVPEGEWPVQEREQQSEWTKALRLESPLQTESPKIGNRQPVQDWHVNVEVNQYQSAQLDGLLDSTENVIPSVTGVQTTLGAELEVHEAADTVDISLCEMVPAGEWRAHKKDQEIELNKLKSSMQAESPQIGEPEAVEDGAATLGSFYCQSSQLEVFSLQTTEQTFPCGLPFTTADSVAPEANEGADINRSRNSAQQQLLGNLAGDSQCLDSNANEEEASACWDATSPGKFGNLGEAVAVCGDLAMSPQHQRFHLNISEEQASACWDATSPGKFGNLGEAVAVCGDLAMSPQPQRFQLNIQPESESPPSKKPKGCNNGVTTNGVFECKSAQPEALLLEEEAALLIPSVVQPAPAVQTSLLQPVKLSGESPEAASNHVTSLWGVVAVGQSPINQHSPAVDLDNVLGWESPLKAELSEVGKSEAVEYGGAPQEVIYLPSPTDSLLFEIPSLLVSKGVQTSANELEEPPVASSFATSQWQMVAPGQFAVKQDKPQTQFNKAVEALLAGAIRREEAAEDKVRRQAAEIEQLNRLVRQYKHERECNAILQQSREDKIARLESLMDGVLPSDAFLSHEWAALRNEYQVLLDKYDNHPEVTHSIIQQQRLIEELREYRDFFDLGEKEDMQKDIKQLRKQLDAFLSSGPPPRPLDSRRRSMLMQSISVRQSMSLRQSMCIRNSVADGTALAMCLDPNRFGESLGKLSDDITLVVSEELYPDRKRATLRGEMTQLAEDDLSPVNGGSLAVTETRTLDEQEREWEERENDWMAVLEELREEVDSYRRQAEMRTHELECERRCSEEVRGALQMAMAGHARLLDQYAELQEKHISVLAKHRKIRDGAADLKKMAKRAGVTQVDSKWLEAQATKMALMHADHEEERQGMKEEIEVLRAQLNDTAEAVQAAGELLVRLKEAEAAASIAQDSALLAEQDADALQRELEKTKRKHNTEIATLQQRLLESRQGRAPLCEMCVMAEQRVQLDFNHADEESARAEMEAEELESADLTAAACWEENCAEGGGQVEECESPVRSCARGVDDWDYQSPVRDYDPAHQSRYDYFLNDFERGWRG